MGMHYVFDAPAPASEIVQGVWCGFVVWRRLGVVGLQCRIKSQNPNKRRDRIGWPASGLTQDDVTSQKERT